MDPPRSSSRSRRSYPNLHNLSIAPLSAKYPLDASVPPSPDEQGAVTPRTSYIVQKSAPATPGVLSLGQSRSTSRHRQKVPYAYDSYFMAPGSEMREVGDIPKANSMSMLHPGVSFADEITEVESERKRRHTRKGTAPLPLRSPGIKHHTKESNDEWFHRAGLAIAGETRDSKGQGWLVRRESSTSLVGDGDPLDQHHVHDDRRMALLSGEHISDVDFPSYFSQRNSRAASRLPSRVGSRVPSTRQSRRGSRVGSRVDLMTGLGGGFKNPSGRQSFDISELEERFIEPDFIEADEESDGDEQEVARLARERGFGLGGWMDNLLGWSLFSVDEDREGSSSDDDDDVEDSNGGLRLDNITTEELKLRREVEAKRRKLEREAIIAASALNRCDGDASESSRPSTADESPPSTNEEAGGWQDAAWLLSVASKALF
ncbi:ornithine mitochondrial [Pyrenophora seminiperda CCB06]|uniref:Ornithine mitochondrial n=1 Tax=Pyrenophora seminiperda CCB06 TaxID=1302712 RepID=A0A3M7LUU7_9PLEO|nr:ornithine mitochondrial [Pyrenophora seminiperda CCB06]